MKDSSLDLQGIGKSIYKNSAPNPKKYKEFNTITLTAGKYGYSPNSKQFI
jgi:hypothetical protein